MKQFLEIAVRVGIFAVPFVMLIIANSLFFPFITGKNFAFRIIVEITFAAWVLLALYDPQYRPRFSWVMVSFAGLLVVMFFANLFGEYPLKSFWSNFERMDGYVTLVHIFMYFVVLGSVFRSEVWWNRFFNVSLFVAVLIAFYAFAQFSGAVDVSQGTAWRLDSTFGNSTYMAIYMLFHTAIAGFMFVRTKSKGLRYFYGFLMLLFVFFMFQTGTRGTVLGFIGGILLTTGYIALFTKGHAHLRKYAIGALIGLLVLVGAFIALRDTALIQENARLKRIADISFEEGSIRFMVWNTALEGIKERPLLGWGQENFNYVFNKEYTPELYRAEIWYDRVHNVVLDWLIAGGILGALFYFGIIAAALWYILLRPFLRREDEPFSVTERGIIFGLLGAYVFHNLFVFDNLASYVYFGAILAFVHSSIARPVERIESFRMDGKSIDTIAAPIVFVALLAVIYMVNVPALRTAGDLIDALRIPVTSGVQGPELQLEAFEKALSHDSFGNQEVREQLLRQANRMINTEGVPLEVKQRAFLLAEAEMQKQIEEKPGDARQHLLLASFYRLANNADKAIVELDIARALSPEKQFIMFEQGFAHSAQGDLNAGVPFFKEAYELAPEYTLARIYYAIAVRYVEERGLFEELIHTEGLKNAYAQNAVALQSAFLLRDYELLEDMYARRITMNPQSIEERINLALIRYQNGNTAGAVEVLRQAVTDIPSFGAQGEQLIEQMQSGALELSGA